MSTAFSQGRRLFPAVGQQCEWDWDGAEREIHRAIELKPNHADVRAEYSFFLAVMKRPEEARTQIDRTIERDPLNPLFQALFGWHFPLVGRYDDAILQLRRTLSKEPNFPAPQNGLWAAFGQKQMHEDLTRGYADGGNSGAMRLAAEQLMAHCKATYVSPIWIALLYPHAEEKRHALAWLEKAYEERNGNMAHLNVDAHWTTLRGEPGFQDLLRGLELPR
jgi:serine/threonine-protein kinase